MLRGPPKLFLIIKMRRKTAKIHSRGQKTSIFWSHIESYRRGLVVDIPWPGGMRGKLIPAQHPTLLKALTVSILRIQMTLSAKRRRNATTKRPYSVPFTHHLFSGPLHANLQHTCILHSNSLPVLRTGRSAWYRRTAIDSGVPFCSDGGQIGEGGVWKAGTFNSGQWIHPCYLHVRTNFALLKALLLSNFFIPTCRFRPWLQNVASSFSLPLLGKLSFKLSSRITDSLLS